MWLRGHGLPTSALDASPSLPPPSVCQRPFLNVSLKAKRCSNDGRTSTKYNWVIKYHEQDTVSPLLWLKVVTFLNKQSTDIHLFYNVLSDTLSFNCTGLHPIVGFY